MVGLVVQFCPILNGAAIKYDFASESWLAHLFAIGASLATLLVMVRTNTKGVRIGYVLIRTL